MDLGFYIKWKNCSVADKVVNHVLNWAWFAFACVYLVVLSAWLGGALSIFDYRMFDARIGATQGLWFPFYFFGGVALLFLLHHWYGKLIQAPLYKYLSSRYPYTYKD